MYHRLQFRANYQLDLRMPGKSRLQRVAVAKGVIIEAKVRPYVKETISGPVEVADLDLPGEAALLRVPMECFSFV